MKVPSMPRGLYDHFIQHWIQSAIILTVPSYWFLLLRVGGTRLGLTTQSGGLTTTGHWITWPLFALSLIFALMKTAADRYNDEAKMTGGFILERLLDSVNAVNAAKMRRFSDYVERTHGVAHIVPFRDIVQPEVQIVALLENLQVALSEIFGIDRTQIGLSILCKAESEGHWRFLRTVNTELDLRLEDVVANPSTTARQIIDNKYDIRFFVDKREGIQKQQYVPGLRDVQFENIGSILCKDISVGGEHRNMRAVLSITTYGKFLCPPGNEVAKSKIKNYILPPFETQLKLELTLLHLKESLESKCQACPALPQAVHV